MRAVLFAALSAAGAVACSSPPFSGTSILLVMSASAPSGTPAAQTLVSASLTLQDTDPAGAVTPVSGAHVTVSATGGGSATLAETNPEDASDYEGSFMGAAHELSIAVVPAGGAEIDQTFEMPDLPTLTTEVAPSGLTILWSPSGQADETQVAIKDPTTGQGSGGGSAPGDPGRWLLLPSQFTNGNALYELDVERSIESGTRGGAFDAIAGVTATIESPEP